MIIAKNVFYISVLEFGIIKVIGVSDKSVIVFDMYVVVLHFYFAF